MTNTTPVRCDLHDRLELACLRRYDAVLTLRDGSELRGRWAAGGPLALAPRPVPSPR